MDWKILALCAMIFNGLLLFSFDFLSQRHNSCFEIILLIYGSAGVLSLILYFTKKKKRN